MHSKIKSRIIKIDIRKSKPPRDKIFLSLFNNKIVKLLETQLIGPINEIKSCQIASRFPGENCIKDWQNNWHIDNFTEKDFKRHALPSEFTRLLGIYLVYT